MAIYKYHIGYRMAMKSFLIIIIFVIFVIPISIAYSDKDKLDIKMAHQIPFDDLGFIEKIGDPHASAYVIIRNSDGELVGVSHVHASRYLMHPILPMFLDQHETIERFSIENQSFEMKKVELDLPIKEQHCLFYRESMPCYYYTFSTALGISYDINGEHVTKYGFRGLHHAYIAEDGDNVEVTWKILWPKN